MHLQYIYITHFKFVKDGAHLNAQKSNEVLTLSFFKISNIIFLVLTSKGCEIGFSVLSSTSIPIFMIFYPRLLPQLSEKRDKKEQSMKKMQKLLSKPLSKVKQIVLIVRKD